MSKKNKKMIHIAIMMIIMLGFGFLPPIKEMTEVGMQVTGIFLGGIYGWITIGLLLPSLLGIILLGLTDITTTTELFASGFGNQSFVLVLGMMILTSFLSQSRLSAVIVKTLMNLKFAKGKPYLTVACILFANFGVAAISNSLISALLFLPLYAAAIKDDQTKQYSKLNNAMVTGVAFSGLMGVISLPTTATVIMMTTTFTSASNITIDLGKYVLFVFPFSIFLLICYILICKFVLRIDASPLVKISFGEMEETMTKKQKVSFACLLLTIALLLLPNLLPEALWLTQILKQLGYGGSILLALFIMAVIYVDGEPLLDIEKMAKEANWGLIFLVAYFLPIASMLTSDATGIKATMASSLEPILCNMPAVAIIIFLAAVAVIATNFLNNAVVTVVMVSTACVLSDFLVGYNLIAVALILFFSANIAIVLPSASPANAYCLSYTDLIRLNEQIKFAIKVAVCLFTILLIVGLPYLSLVWK